MVDSRLNLTSNQSLLNSKKFSLNNKKTENL